MNCLDILIDLENEDYAETHRKIFEFETGNNISDKAEVSISREGTKLRLRIESDDLIALRAFLNSMLRLFRSSIRISSDINA